MKWILASLLLLAAPARAEHSGWLLVEESVATEVAKPQTTVVHLWAPWCPNSQAENRDDGWGKFIAAHPSVQFVFVTVRSADDGRAYLAAHGVGGQPNLILLHHPNPVRKGEGSIHEFMDLPVSWVPTTWIFRDGKLRYALNYGEVRFPMLQQLLADTAATWEH
ncbi:MAG: TlpA family protein disulfide reductase [Opitutales bacterium]